MDFALLAPPPNSALGLALGLALALAVRHQCLLSFDIEIRKCILLSINLYGKQRALY